MARPKKVHRFKLTEFPNPAGSVSWRVSGTKLDGSRIRQNFDNKLAAIQALADLEGETEGNTEDTRARRTRLTAEQLADAEAASGTANGRSLATVVSHYLSLEARAKAKGLDLDTAIAFTESHHRHETKEVTILAASTEFTETRHGRTKSTLAHYETILRLLLKPDPNKPVHRFSVGDIEKILARYTNVNSKRTVRRIFSIFFGWCVRHHYCLEDPCKRLDKLPKDISQISVLSLDEVKRLLYAAVRYQDGAAAAAIAIGLFAGLRPSEINDLKKEDIGEKGIRVSGGKLRRTLKRTVPIPQVLTAWLKAYPFTGLPKGWQYKMNALKEATKAAKWVQDIIRHTSITFQTERDRNEALTAFNNGTSKAMMDLHYRNTIDEETTVTGFWSLTPAKLLKERPEITLPEKKKVTWPEKSVLAKLVWRKPLVHAATDIGVSDVALRKRCVKLGIELPTQGHWLREQRDRK